jgi:hypothetical protein
MRTRERRQRTRLPGDPLRAERLCVVEAIRSAGAAPGVASPVATALASYAARARALGVDLEALVAEFRSVFDRSVPRNPADFGHSLRRERFVGLLLTAFNDATPA